MTFLLSGFTPINLNGHQDRSSGRPLSRLEIQRRKLESDNMLEPFSSFGTLSRFNLERLERDLERRRQVREHLPRPMRVARFGSLRKSLGRVLILAGERIRPQTA